MPRPATAGLTPASDSRAPQFRSALERLQSATADGPAAARLGDALRRDRASEGDVSTLLTRYGSERSNDDGLRSALERLSQPIQSTRPVALSSGRKLEARRPGGGSVDYAAGPLTRLSNPRSVAADALDRDAAQREPKRGDAASAEEIAQARKQAAHAKIAAAQALDASLDLSPDAPYAGEVYSTGSDFYYGVQSSYWHHHNYHGHHWWGSPWSFGLTLCWPSYSFGVSPLWLNHPVYGYYPWYGSFGLGYCGYSSWWYGSYGSYSWGPYSYWHQPSHHSYVVYEEAQEPQVIVVEQQADPIVIYVEQPAAPLAEEQVDVAAASTFVAPVTVEGEPQGQAQPRALGVAADRYLTLGDRAFRDGRYADAVHYYTKAVQLQPDVPILHLLLFDALFATGDYAAAASAVRSAIAGDPSLIRTVVDKRTFYSDERAFDRQLAVCELYLADHPTDDDARLVLAVNLLFASAPASAVDLLESDHATGLRGDPIARLVLEAGRDRQYGEIAAPPQTSKE